MNKNNVENGISEDVVRISRLFIGDVRWECLTILL